MRAGNRNTAWGPAYLTTVPGASRKAGGAVGGYGLGFSLQVVGSGERRVGSLTRGELLDAMSVMSAAFALAASSVAQKCADALIGDSWSRASAKLRGILGRDPKADDLQGPDIRHLPDDPELFGIASKIVGSSSCLRRAALAHRALAGARLLWIDDRPEHNTWERAMLSSYGLEILTVETTRSAIEALRAGRIDVIVSDLAREGVSDEGVRALPLLRSETPTAPLIFYVGRLDPSRGVPVGAHGITNRPDELFHLILDVLERGRL